MYSQRKLPDEIKDKAIRLLQAKANKKIVRTELSLESGNVVTMRDIHNLSQKAKYSNSRNDIAQVIDILRNEFGKLNFVVL